MASCRFSHRRSTSNDDRPGEDFEPPHQPRDSSVPQTRGLSIIWLGSRCCRTSTLGGWNADRGLVFTGRAFAPRTAAVTMMTAPAFTARSARTTPIQVPATRTAGFIARRPDGRPGSAIWATPPWRTCIGCGGRQGTHANRTAERRASEAMLKARR